MAASCLPCTWLPAFELDHALEPLLLLSSNRRLKLISPLSCNNSNSTSFAIRKRRQSHANQAAAYSASDGKTTAVSAKSEKAAPEVKRRVVVTGLGAVTPLSDDAHLYYTKLLEGVSGISQIEGFDCSKLPTRIAGEIKTLSTDGLVSPKHAKRADNYLIYALVAGKKALADAGITEQVSGELNKNRCGVLIGTAMGSMRALKDGIDAIKISHKKMSPFSVPYSMTSMASAVLAMDLEWMGPNYAISSACATSNCCILTAANHIIKGDADLMLCGGSDGVIIPEGIAGFIACNNLSRRNSDPTKASRPWDSQDRDGFVMGEGAGVMLLEELEHAKRRGADIYAEFMGGSFTCDAYHKSESRLDGFGAVACVESSGLGAVACMEKALTNSGVSREDVNYINAHATSTRVGDPREFKAVMHCFGQNPELRMNSTKSMTGHLLGAAGAVEAIATVKMLATSETWNGIRDMFHLSNFNFFLLLSYRQYRLDGYIQTSILKTLTKMWTLKCLLALRRNV
ncbi:3-oxoacyl-[acyl-carrier-protein] synthase II, chloroplastic-like isoform X4 [Citrus sinensis]|uniref:3-oxoacyl-[acyl-carrier-protein] synthase II, chloroplastic-like isoform X4 n=1 Tax=Citrus sinensis TaxID=2711 RepID=UPI002278F88B|nr:3-oxoacyl-[acyl-carrier-protein] synthase II, chloroplastic-like isoform X4 [Citrus sinensis]